MPDILIAGTVALLAGLGCLAVVALVERSAPKDPDPDVQPKPCETPAKDISRQSVAHYLPVAINLPLPVGEINISTTKYIRQRPIVEVYFALFDVEWHELEKSDAWKQFQQALVAVQHENRGDF